MPASVVSISRIFRIMPNGDLERITTTSTSPNIETFLTGSGFDVILKKNPNLKYVLGTDGNVYKRQKDYLLKNGEILFRPHVLDLFYVR